MERAETKKISAVIFDWAGTTVDYGCMAPLEAFIQSFRKEGIHVTDEEVRGPMGMKKKDHIRALLELESVRLQWTEKFGKLPEESDVDQLYASFEPMLMAVLPNYTEVIPGAIELVDSLRLKGMKIGSTTGYTLDMMKVVTAEAEKQGYKPDYWIASDEVPAGRPAPYMCYRNALELQVFPMDTCVKIGDTVSDIQEGINAGAWSVGVICGGSEFGLTERQTQELGEEELRTRMAAVRSRFERAGAHFTVDAIAELETVIEEINQRLARGEHPQACGVLRSEA
ncbi:phosphonoacetaldehyde hydrolase [Paenibacillus sp. J5C_2022]|uniref:phosphonoacetaldehyde hydrolase n=1 Tax=Paenibacillus sp. J5C2022 TaxID=2977129 RepID=UPI0021CE8528|nr:phosphonoacetaldehyde hydrolase [Paenibacillus sp. J5C2022]MCU6710185.1 phosphonoacetaldehyde hydrolase [Paenibacillus sp. J5C2022]